MDPVDIDSQLFLSTCLYNRALSFIRLNADYSTGLTEQPV